MRDLVILGSTGSIGVQALEIVRNHPDKFRVVALAAGSSNYPLLAQQAQEFGVPIVATSGERSPLTSLIKGEVIDAQ